MANENATMEKTENLDGLDFDELEKQLQEQLEGQMSDLEGLKEQIGQVGNPEVLGSVILDTVWEQFTNQIAIKAGEDFIKDNNGLHLDLSDEAHIQTTENFANGKIATHNTEIDYQKRYDDWQDNFQKDPNTVPDKKNYRYNEEKQVAEKYDNRSKTWKPVLKKDARKDFDKGRPTGNDTDRTNADHTVSAAEIIRDPEAAAHMTREEQVAFANSEKNINIMDSAANQSKQDSSMDEWLESERDGKKPVERFDIDEEALRQKDKEAREEYEKQKREAEQRSIAAGKKTQKAEALRIGKKAARAIIMNLLADLVKKIIKKLIIWLKSDNKNLKSLLVSIKDAIISFVVDLKKHVLNVTDTALTVIATSIVGPVIGTIKKAWMFIKQGWASLKEAIQYIKNPENKGKPIGIIMMEVGKIVTAGLTVAGAIVLGDVIEKGLMTIPVLAFEIPLFGSIANIIGTFMGAVISGIIGALAIHLINKMIEKQQKEQLSADKVDKGNEILATQNEIINVNEQKLNATKEKVVSTVRKRHEAAAEVIRDSLEAIVNNNGESNEEEFKQMNRKLNKLAEEGGN